MWVTRSDWKHFEKIKETAKLQNTSCIRKPQVISGRTGGAHPLHPPPRSAPDIVTRPYFYYHKKFREDHRVIMNELEKKKLYLMFRT